VQAIQRTIESTRIISKVNTDFFATLERHSSKLSQFVEEMQIVHDKKLEDLERKFEVDLFLSLDPFFLLF
jgi:hypothetical protein